MRSEILCSGLSAALGPLPMEVGVWQEGGTCAQGPDVNGLSDPRKPLYLRRTVSWKKPKVQSLSDPTSGFTPDSMSHSFMHNDLLICKRNTCKVESMSEFAYVRWFGTS